MNFRQFYSFIAEHVKIAAPAVKDLETGRVFKGRLGEMHVNIYDRLVSKLAAMKKIRNFDKAANLFNKKFGKRFESGFVDNNGKYYNRSEAFELSREKILAKDPERRHKELASEDLPDLA